MSSWIPIWLVTCGGAAWRRWNCPQHNSRSPPLQLRYSSRGSRATTDRATEVRRRRRPHASRGLHGAAEWRQRRMDQPHAQDHRGRREADLARVLDAVRGRQYWYHDVHLDPRERRPPCAHRAEPRHHPGHRPSGHLPAPFAWRSNSRRLACRTGSPPSRAHPAPPIRRSTRPRARLGTTGSQRAECSPPCRRMAGRHLPLSHVVTRREEEPRDGVALDTGLAQTQHTHLPD